MRHTTTIIRTTNLVDSERLNALERLLRDHHFHVMFTEEGFDVFHGAATEEEPLPTLREAIDRAMARVA